MSCWPPPPPSLGEPRQKLKPLLSLASRYSNFKSRSPRIGGWGALSSGKTLELRLDMDHATSTRGWSWVLADIEGALEGADDALEGIGGAAVGFVFWFFGLDVAEGAIQPMLLNAFPSKAELSIGLKVIR